MSLDNALGFKPFWKLPNLFVPVGRRLHPTLRRDAVRKLLADDADRVVLALPPTRTESSHPESVPDGAFRSLEDWVDYVIEAEQKPLGAWIEATRFDFDHFICKDAGGPKTKPDKPERDLKAKDDDEARGPQGRMLRSRRLLARGKAVPGRGTTADFLPTQEIVKPAERVEDSPR